MYKQNLMYFLAFCLRGSSRDSNNAIIHLNCSKHYKEYLVLLINKAELDPLPMYDTDKIVVILKREEKEVPEREDETDEEYRARLIKVHVGYDVTTYTACMTI